MTKAREEIDRAVRRSYGRLIAFLSARTGDVEGAQDALSGALEAALAHWSAEGVPDNPEAWLLTAARRRLIDDVRHRQVQEAGARELLVAAEGAGTALESTHGLPDERLRLLFVCAHPAIEQAARAPLMLQVVLGLDAEEIAEAFVIPAATMGQRLSRAKARIRAAQIPFEVPEERHLHVRLDAVLDAIYAAFGRGWAADQAPRAGARDLAREALDLGTMLAAALPGKAESHGLVALMLYAHARRGARRGPDGSYVPLLEQDPRRWDEALMSAADEQLRRAASLGELGRFQLEAAIQAAHVERRHGGAVSWPAIASLYEGLVRIAPTVGALVGRAAAVAEAQGADAGWKLLRELPPARMAPYAPYHALKAHLLERRGADEEAAQAYRQAAHLSEDPAEKTYLEKKAAGCRKG